MSEFYEFNGFNENNFGRIDDLNKIPNCFDQFGNYLNENSVYNNELIQSAENAEFIPQQNASENGEAVQIIQFEDGIISINQPVKLNVVDVNQWCDLEEHECEIDENGQCGYSSFDKYNNSTISQLRSNLAETRAFLKNNLNFDVPALTEDGKGAGPNANGEAGQKMQHVCHLCDRKFVHASGLTRHLAKHTADDTLAAKKNHPNLKTVDVVLKCTLCGRLFSQERFIYEHLLYDHNYWYFERDDDYGDLSDTEDIKEEYPLLDETASEYLINKQKAKVAVAVKMQEESIVITNYIHPLVKSEVYHCEFCEYTFSNIDTLLVHESSHVPSIGYECRFCSIHVPNLKDIQTHWATECVKTKHCAELQINLTEVYYCNVCDERFYSLEKLCEHRFEKFHFFPRSGIDDEYLTVNCSYCGELFYEVAMLVGHHSEKHVKKTTEVVNYTANTTSYSCNDSTVAVVNENGNNNTHKKATSTKYRQYLCDVCGKSYTQSSHLWQHLRFHKGVKPFMCKEEGCSRRFTIRPDLNDHIRKCHTRERPYHCSVCDKRFLTGSVFYQHRLIHRGERRYGCSNCSKRFYRADALKNHNRIHTGEKPYTCMYCTKAFRQRGDRDKHIRARHAIEAKDHREEMKIHDRESQKKRLNENQAKTCNTKTDIYGDLGEINLSASMFKPLLQDIDGDYN